MPDPNSAINASPRIGLLPTAPRGFTRLFMGGQARARAVVSTLLRVRTLLASACLVFGTLRQPRVATLLSLQCATLDVFTGAPLVPSSVFCKRCPQHSSVPAQP